MTLISGPLAVSRSNPRYFAATSVNGAEREVVYLTGSHVNNNFHDGLGFGLECPTTSEVFDYAAYLAFLKDHGHNFIRLWRWEQFKGQLVHANVHCCMTPQPWSRTGPGLATDGKPKFDLSSFAAEYFERLRARVIDAGNAGIYVAVMFFEGFSLHLTAAPDNVEGHPFHAKNNVNGIGITSLDDYQVLPLDPRVQQLQNAYIEKVIDTVHDLPNVLYEVANESSGGGSIEAQFAEAFRLDATSWGDTTQWQYWVIDTIKQYEERRGYQKHPVGMTMQYPVVDQRRVNEPLFNSPADWISPGFDDPAPGEEAGGPPANTRWRTDPPTNDGAKVIISDTDHYAPMGSDALWAWKSFLRGHHPILYDLSIVSGVNPPDRSAGQPSYDSLEPARHAMGDTLRYAQKVRLIDMTPRGELASTAYALVNPGKEYLVLQPSENPDALSVSVEAGEYAIEWFSVHDRETINERSLRVERDRVVDFQRPSDARGPVVLYLKRNGQ
jgi:hypothetical protein